MYKWILTYGENLPDKANVIRNGTFADGSVWVMDPGWSITAGKAVADGYAYEASLAQQGVLVAGKEYNVKFTISDYTQGVIEVYDSVVPASPMGYTANQDVDFTYVSGGGSFIIWAKFDFIGKIDNVQVLVNVEAETEIHPIYSDDGAVKEIDQESDEMFFREKLSGEFELSGDDFDFIFSKPFDRRFSLHVYIYGNQQWLPYWNGYFYRKDCKCNEYARQLTVSFKADDDYDVIIKGKAKEFNLIELEPEIAIVKYTRRPVWQFYWVAKESLMNFNGHLSWEQKCTQVTTVADMEDVYFFKQVVDMRGTCTGLSSGANQLFVWKGTYWYPTAGGANYFESMDGEWRVRPGSPATTWELYNVLTGVSYGQTLTNDDPWVAAWSNISGSSIGFERLLIGCRILTGLPVPSGDLTTHTRPTSDIVEWSGDYNLIMQWGTGKFYFSEDTVGDPTRYGKVLVGPNEGEYYAKPFVSEQLVPLVREQWGEFSLWWERNLATDNIDGAQGEVVSSRHCYPLYSVISKLLEAIGSDVLHDDTSAYSTWLYSARYIGLHTPTIFITPKTNIIYSNYTQAASKAMITLDQVLEMLRVMYRAYWHIIDKRLVIETVRFYQNGNRYTAQSIQLDLRSLYHPRSNKQWAFDSTSYSFDDLKMPEKIEYRWMDTTSEFFDGYPIEIQSAFVEAGEVLKRDISKFTGDLDFVMISPDEVNKEGFVVLDAPLVLGENIVPYVSLSYKGEDVLLQNGYCSFIFLHPQFHGFDLPVNTVKMNDESVTLASNIARAKVGDHEFPLSTDPSPYRLIVTNIGTGKPKGLKINLTTRMVNATLEYDTE